MKFSKSFGIFSRNIDVVLRTVITQVIVIAGAIGIGVLLIGDNVINANNDLEQYGIITALEAVMAELVSPNFTGKHFQYLLSQLGSSFLQWTSQIDYFYHLYSIGVMLLVLTVYVLKFLLSFPEVALFEGMNDFLSSGGKRPFYWRLFNKIGRTSVAQLLNLAFGFTLDIVFLFASVGLYAALFSSMGIAGIILTLLIMVLFWSLRKSFFAFFIPKLVLEPTFSPSRALREGLKSLIDVFGRVFLKVFTVAAVTIFSVVLVFLINISWWTLLLAMILIVVSENYVNVLCLMEYYKKEDMKFHTHKVVVVKN